MGTKASRCARRRSRRQRAEPVAAERNASTNHDGPRRPSSAAGGGPGRRNPVTERSRSVQRKLHNDVIDADPGAPLRGRALSKSAPICEPRNCVAHPRDMRRWRMPLVAESPRVVKRPGAAAMAALRWSSPGAPYHSPAQRGDVPPDAGTSRSRVAVVSVVATQRGSSPPIAFTLWPTKPTRNDVRMAFADDELDYLRTQPLARLATVAPDGQPDVTPVALEVEGTTVWVCGAGKAISRTRKIRNITAGHRQVALVVDDLPSLEPFVARGMRVYGTGEGPIDRVGMVGPGITSGSRRRSRGAGTLKVLPPATPGTRRAAVHQHRLRGTRRRRAHSRLQQDRRQGPLDNWVVASRLSLAAAPGHVLR